MPHNLPQFESKNNLGTTVPVNGTVGTTPTLLPSVAGKQISKVWVRCSPNNPSILTYLDVAVDGGTTYVRLSPGEWFLWEPRNNASNSPIKQIRLVGSAAGVIYETITDFEP